MSGTRTAVRLDAERHYEGLRDAVWLRVATDNPKLTWTAFEDAYQEAWEWVAACQSDGREVVVESGSPVAYLAQTVRRRHIDSLRASWRGVGRDAPRPVVDQLDDHAEVAVYASEDDGDDAREARRAISAVYLLARERLSPRELQAFALSYVLEMPPRDAALAMGISVKRFRNLRWDGWRKVGDEVLSVLEGHLQWCESEEARRLRARAIDGDPGAAGPLRVHMESCATCSHSVAATRRAAAAVLPLPMLLGHPQLGLVEVVAGWLARPATRLWELSISSAPGGRATAALAAVAAMAGGGFALERSVWTAPSTRVAAPEPTTSVAPEREVAPARPVAPAPPSARPARQPETDRREQPRRSAPLADTRPTRGAPSSEVASTAPAPSPVLGIERSAQPTPPPTGEFGFE